MLCRARFWLSVLLLCGLAAWATETEVAAQQTKKKPVKPPSPGSPPVSATTDPNETKNKPPLEGDTVAPGRYRGTLVGTPNEGGLFRVAVEYQRIRVKSGKQAQYDRMQRDMTKLLGTAAGEQMKALTGAQLTPLTGQGRVPDWRDRITVAGAAGKSAGSSAKFEALKAQLIELLETVQDTRTVIFHAAPKIVEVRVLKPSEKRELVTAPPESKTTENPKKGQDVLPGYPGAMSDLKIGQRILLTLKPTKNEGKQKGVAPESIYNRLVTLVVVEEEPERDSSSK